MTGSQSPENTTTSCLPPELTGPTPQDGDKPTSSIFARNEKGPIHNVPMRVIHRPLPSELDEEKVKSFMREMEVGPEW